MQIAHRKNLFSVLLLLYLLHPANAFALSNETIASTGQPGTFFIVTYVPGDVTGWGYISHTFHHLAIAEEYGSRITLLRDEASRIDYQCDLDVLSFWDSGHFISSDGGWTTELCMPDYEDRGFNWLPNVDSLIAVDYHRYYSWDTLTTWINMPDRGLEGSLTSSEKRSSIGWSAGDYAVISGLGSNRDSIGFYFTESYCDTFQLRATSDQFSWNVELFRGFSPGELYLNTIPGLYLSTDTMRTWTFQGETPLYSNYFRTAEYEAGWQPGELLCLYSYYDEWTTGEDPEFEQVILRTTDFAQSWNLQHTSFPFYEESPGGIQLSGTRESIVATIDTIWNGDTTGLRDLFLEQAELRWNTVQPDNELIALEFDSTLHGGDTTQLRLIAQPGAFPEPGAVEGEIVLSFEVPCYPDYPTVHRRIQVTGALEESNFLHSPGRIEIHGTTETCVETGDTITNRSPMDTLFLTLDSIEWTCNPPREGTLSPQLPDFLPPGQNGLFALNPLESAFLDTGALEGVATLLTNSLYHPVVQIPIEGHLTSTNAMVESDPSESPTRFSILNTYPQPFNSTVFIRVSVPSAGKVHFSIYNLLGESVVSFNQHCPAGIHEIPLSMDQATGNVASGIYFVVLNYMEQVAMQRIVLLK